MSAVAIVLCGTAHAAPDVGLNELVKSSNVFFVLLGAVLILAMHGGFAFLEVGSVRRKNQVNALNKMICEWSFSTLIYFLIGYAIARGGVAFFSQLLVTAGVVVFAMAASAVVYGLLKATVGIRLDSHAERTGTDVAAHRIEANPEEAF
jgi:ammonia channel protein AmtB